MRGFSVSLTVLSVWIATLGALPVLSTSLIPSPVWADDGDDSDGDDGDEDDGYDYDGASHGRINSGEVGSPHEIIRGLRHLFRGQPVEPQRARRRPAPQPAPRPARARAEIVARGLTDDQTADLVTQGYVVLERADLVSLATTVRRLRVPDGTTLDAARDTIRALPGAEAADFNHYYRAGQDNTAVTETAPACDGLHCPARDLINWPMGLGSTGCGAPVTIGMVDTGLNTDHEVLAGSDIDLTRIAPENSSAATAIHGTAVAAILVGDPRSRVPGLLPGLPLVAVDAFHQNAGDERADAFTLVRAVDHLAEKGVQVINLSVAGPPNTVLEETLLQLTGERRIPVIAAVGNDGPQAEAAYPAAYDSVIAVTAVDRNGTVYRRAIRGAHVEISAPGVDVWTAASVKGARWKTGTSFAAPYVTAAVALWLQHDPMQTPEEIRARLIASADDLGPNGLDETYGHGVLNLRGTCPGRAVFLPASAE